MPINICCVHWSHYTLTSTICVVGRIIHLLRTLLYCRQTATSFTGAYVPAWSGISLHTALAVYAI